MNILNAKLFKFDSYKEKRNSTNASSDSTECSSEVKMKRKRLNVFKKIPVHLFSINHNKSEDLKMEVDLKRAHDDSSDSEGTTHQTKRQKTVRNF
jgi:hypothetical protein